MIKILNKKGVVIMAKNKFRIFNIMQYERHPETGEVLLLENKIKDALAHRTIKRWAYGCHDRDVYSALDEEMNPDHVQGNCKPRHWHICIEMGSNAAEIGTIAKWFGIPENFVNIAKGAGAFLDCVQYLTHEGEKQQELGKRLYDDSEIHANFDFREALNKRSENKIKYGKDLDEKAQMEYDVLYNGKTLKECEHEDRLTFMENLDRLKKLRLEFISRMNPPSTRMNFYVEGTGGIGKGVMCRALARSLCPISDDDDDIFFNVGPKGAPFEGYDGQPVIIWNDRRHYDLLKELGGRGNVFNVFDVHPTKQRQNIKYGSINLCNTINIVNSVEPWTDFLNGLCDAHDNEDSEDRSQSYRRFPFISILHADDYDLMLNRGFMEDTDNFFEYFEHKNIIGNMQKIRARCRGNEKLAQMIEARAIEPVLQLYGEVMEKFKDSPMSADEEQQILDEFKNVGIKNNIAVPDSDDSIIVRDGKRYYKTKINGAEVLMELLEGPTPYLENDDVPDELPFSD